MSQPFEVLGGFFAQLRLSDLDDALVRSAKVKLLDSLACAYAAADYEGARFAVQTGEQLGAGSCTTLVGNRRLTPHDATFVNSVLIHAILQDDVDLEAGHPACAVVPAALAFGEQRNGNGEDLLLALVIGYEAMWRVGGCGHFMMRAAERGFRGNTILGAFGSAAAAAKMLDLPADGIANALALAASFAAGLLEPLNQGSIERVFQQGANAQHGAMAALLSATGVKACQTVLTGATGFYPAFSDSEYPMNALDSLGTEFRMPSAFSKPYPSAGSNTVGLAVLEYLLEDRRVASEDVTAVTAKVLPRFTGVPGYPSIAFRGPFSTVEQGLISFPFQLACMARKGKVDLEAITEGISDADVTDLVASVELQGTDVPHPLWCEIEVSTRSGDRLSANSDEISWSEFYPDEASTQAKFAEYATGHLTEERAQQIVDTVWDLESLSDVSQLTALLRHA